MATRLTENHPLSKKFNQLECFMDELNISIEWDGYNLILKDTESNTDAYIKDIDYHNSDECIIENIEANEYEFTADGRRF